MNIQIRANFPYKAILPSAKVATWKAKPLSVKSSQPLTISEGQVKNEWD